MAHNLTTSFASNRSSTQQTCASTPNPGTKATLRVRVTVDFRYNGTVAGRRRRRSVSSETNLGDYRFGLHGNERCVCVCVCALWL